MLSGYAVLFSADNIDNFFNYYAVKQLLQYKLLPIFSSHTQNAILYHELHEPLQTRETISRTCLRQVKLLLCFDSL